MAYDLIVFDWDGTLADSTDRIVDGLIQAGRSEGLPEITPKEGRSVIGLALNEALSHLWPAINGEQLERLNVAYHHFHGLGDHSTQLFDGAAALLTLLSQHHRVKSAVATGKARYGLDLAFTELSHPVERWFVDSICADESLSKPNPDMLVTLCSRLQVAPERALMIGDTTFDLDMAHRAGVDAIGVTYGAHDATMLKQSRALCLCDSVVELERQILTRL